jgi:hypothetical protein
MDPLPLEICVQSSLRRWLDIEDLGDHVNWEPDLTELQFLCIESIKFSPNPVQVNVEFAAHNARRLGHVDGSRRLHEPEENLVGG